MALTQTAPVASLPYRYNTSTDSLDSGRQEALVESWETLLNCLRSEIDLITQKGAHHVPSIDYSCIHEDSKAADFAESVRRGGVGIVRGVIPNGTTTRWITDTERYLSINSATGAFSHEISGPGHVFWSPAQVRARAHPDVLRAQTFLLNLWHTSDPDTPISTNFPLTCAEPLPLGPRDDISGMPTPENEASDNGTKPTQSMRDATLRQRALEDGSWETNDPWDSSMLPVGSNDPTKSMVRMFNGWLCLSNQPPDGHGPSRIYPWLQSSIGYSLLRPFFRPCNASPSHPEYLHGRNWVLESTPSSTAHYLGDVLPPAITAPIPTLRPGDYFVWHRDIPLDMIQTAAPQVTGVPLSVCPLTETNARQLARQRRAFLLGLPVAHDREGKPYDERGHISGRPGVQEVSDTGGHDGLRAMGLMPWEEDGETTGEAEILGVANDILFPDRNDFPMD